MANFLSSREQRVVRKPAGDNLSEVSKELSNDAMHLNLREESATRSRAASRPTSAAILAIRNLNLNEGSASWLMLVPIAAMEDLKKLLIIWTDAISSIAPRKSSDYPYSNRTISKIKRGLPGFLNGSRISAFPDTGSVRNVISEAYAKAMKLKIEGSSSGFVLGNSRTTQSLGKILFALYYARLGKYLLLIPLCKGTVCFNWAFSESPKDTLEVVCDVLPGCTYNLIFGSKLLTVTQTLSIYKRRLAMCFFPWPAAFILLS
jgi:hypothetical protein